MGKSEVGKVDRGTGTYYKQENPLLILLRSEERVQMEVHINFV
jgi:hypothetical protein